MGRVSTKANIFMHGTLAGRLERIGSRVRFQYDAQYLKIGSALSMSLPLRPEPYESEGLPPYFSGLCSEGWLKRVQAFEQPQPMARIPHWTKYPVKQYLPQLFPDTSVI